MYNQACRQPLLMWRAPCLSSSSLTVACLPQQAAELPKVLARPQQVDAPEQQQGEVIKKVWNVAALFRME
jgi:hypothetical protein